MLSIHHNPPNVQVGSSIHLSYPGKSAKKTNPAPIVLSPLQQTAFELHDLGLNVFPQPIGKKGGFPWKALQFNRLERDHARYGLQPVFAGNTNLAIMCGRTSGNLFVIDCESPAALRYHMQQLHQRQIPLWVVRTARGGHIYLRAAEGEVHNVVPGILANAEIKGQMGYVLAPPSVHPTGAIYHWLYQEGDNIPVVSVTDIDWLRDQMGDPVQLQVTISHEYTPGLWKEPRQPQGSLSRTTQDYLQNGHALPEGCRNNRLFAATCDLAGNGYSEQDSLRTLLPIARNSGLPEREIQSTIASAYSKPRTPSRNVQTPGDINDNWWKMLVWTTKHEWQGRTGATDRVMMLSLIERNRLHANENGVFRASMRELAELGRMGSATVQRSLKRLMNQQIIFKCGYDHSSNASLWKFNQKLIHETQLEMDTLALSPHWLSYSVSIFNSELAERGLIGRSVMYVYTYLLLFEGCWLPSSLAEAVGVTVNQANYALRKLSQLGLIVRETEGWRVLVSTVANAESLLASQGADLHRGARRRRRFQRERARFAGRLLVNVRLQQEGAAYYHAAFDGVYAHERVCELLDDPVIVLGLELGGVVRLEDDWVLMNQRK